MRKLAVTVALCTLVLSAHAQAPSCLRVMTIEELVRNSIMIGRAKVHKVDRVRYRGQYGQIAVLVPSDVITGDYTIREVNVLAHSNISCADDIYKENDDVLVFLEPEDSLFHTVNYQYGCFLIQGNIVKDWRDHGNKSCDKPYGEVRDEIMRYVNKLHKPPTQTPPQTPPQTQKPPQTPPQTQKPPLPN